jgi:hypothetical protein
LQPVASRYHWTSGDLLNVLRKLVTDPQAYPCWSEEDLVSYRRHILALPPLAASASPQTTLPQGYDLALELCPPRNPSPPSNS